MAHSIHVEKLYHISKEEIFDFLFLTTLILLLLFEYAYSNGANLILSYWDTSGEPGPGFNIFSVYQAKRSL